MDNLAYLIVMATNILITIYAAIEAFYLIRDSNNGRFVEGDPWHTNQHAGVLLGIIVYGGAIVFMLVYTDNVFEGAWLLIDILINLILAVIIYHFSLERK